MSTFKSFEELDSWKLARELVREIYKISKTTELYKDYGLKDQVQRSAVSIMSNIAEGFERNSRKEFIRFLNIARGSSAEMKSQLYILFDLGHIDKETFEKLYDKTSDISKTILGLINYLKRFSS